MANPFIIALGKIVRSVARLRAGGVGGGSAAPGLVVERLSPRFAVSILTKLPHGVVIVSGTNGKTTTTKIVVELLASQGLRVFTNTSGSNFMRGVISSLIPEISLTGRLNADIAVLELDEAHAVGFSRAIPPRYTLLLNVMDDQLDRFGEADHTADLLAVVAANTTGTVVLNHADKRLATLPQRVELMPGAHAKERRVTIPGEVLTAQLRCFGLAPELQQLFAEDARSKKEQCDTLSSDVTLAAFERGEASFVIEGRTYHTPLELKGIYNAFNAAGALALVRAVFESEGLSSNTESLLTALTQVQNVYGRGETLTVKGRSVEMFLVKNPGGFKLALESYDPQGYATMIAINDNAGDGHDISWLYDVSFKKLQAVGVSVVTGIRAYDMALRLIYDEVPCAVIEPALEKALDCLLSLEPMQPCRIYCNYTSMIALRKLLLGELSV